MKTILFITLSALSLSSYAQVSGQPFFLDSGKYGVECFSHEVEKKADGKLSQIGGGYKGTSAVVKNGNVSLETLEIKTPHFKQNGVIRTEITDLGNSQFKLDIKTNSIQVIGTEVDGGVLAFSNVVHVENNVITNLSTTREDAELEAGRQSYWEKLEDGRIVLHTYMLEPRDFSRTWKDSKGVEHTETGPLGKTLVSYETCVYKKLK